MTREDFECEIIARLEDIKALYRQYNPQAFESGNTPYLSLFINGDFLYANNAYYKIDENNPDRYSPVNCWLAENGKIYHNYF